MCTKARAEALGCTVSGSYTDNQLVPKSALSATVGNLIVDNFSGFSWAIYIGDPSYLDDLSGFTITSQFDCSRTVPLYNIPNLGIDGNIAHLVSTNIGLIKYNLTLDERIYGLRLDIGTTTFKVTKKTQLDKNLFLNYSSGDIHIII